MSDVDVNTYEVEEQNPRVIEREEVVVVERRPAGRGEWLKFGLLALVLLATVLIIALLRPYIFNTIIPAVLGEGQPAAPLVTDEAEAETIKPEIVEEAATAVPAGLTQSLRKKRKKCPPRMPRPLPNPPTRQISQRPYLRAPTPYRLVKTSPPLPSSTASPSRPSSPPTKSPTRTASPSVPPSLFPKDNSRWPGLGS